ncbi:UDP-N-acetylmuramate--L-alanine ligase [Lacibacter sediminis]|uniref:UDP-N-acetylmuramate--L-alanine ligase n=1 Tax=Lacibacter sediminis TaxID=2760713 RepID=A0A7G5XE25_9BACT|nr:UDP-N-acetylmuramate--L-alanine ligase [Lacibacter sediminis]QNA43728.1 UDP-N-acetylmuramate--L-alanine ligase [Lacibacter sediminis]
MIQLNDIKAVYFVGIGGIGMSAIARFFHENGVKVSGYDKTVTALTSQLEAEGISIYYNEDVERIPKDVQLVVYTPAIPKEHKEYQYYLQNGYSVVKRSDVLQIITQSSLNICVAGTHGKTTISTMTGHLLRHSGFGCNAFLGGIAVNYNSNFWASDNNVCVVEADEYDRSFHKLSPDIAVITAMDADHLDIYGTAEAMEEAFIEFTRKIKPGGWLISKYGLKRTGDLVADNHITYHLNDTNATVHSVNLKVQNGSYVFDVVFGDWILKDVLLNVGGLHNVENALAAIAVAHVLKIDDEKIEDAVTAFKGVKRRFEYVIAPGEGDVVFVDDYAHHPEELRALITGARSLFSDKKLVLVFQPHLFTRTRDLADGFAASLDMADEVILLPIYPARELPIEGVTSELILNKMKLEKKQILSKEELLNEVTSKVDSNVVFVTAGAGDIDALLQELKKKIEA